MASEIKTKFVGTWDCVKSEASDEFYAKLGAGPAARQMVPTMVISVDGETISTSISSGSKQLNTASYKLGEEYTVKSENGSGMAVTTYAAGKMNTTVIPNDPSRKGLNIVREIVNGQLVQTMMVDGIEARQYFNKK